VRADEREQPLLTLDTVAPRLREPRRDDDERPDAVRERLLGDLDHARSRHADHGHVDRIGDLAHRAVAADARDRRAVTVHGVGGTLEITLENVPEELTADRSAPLRRADHSDAAGLEERTQGRRDGDMVALGKALLEPLGTSDRERDLDLPARELAGQLEAERLEDAEHPPVVGQHECDEPLDAVVGRPLGELLDETRAHAAPLERVGHRERRLGGRGIAQPRVVRKRHHPLRPVLGERAEQGAALRPVRVEHLLDDLGPERREPVEPHVEALLREGSEEVEDRVGVRARRWPKAQGASVAEDHVDDVGHRRILPLVRRRRHDTQRRGSNGPSHG
jgi:hypothetical protein